MMTEPSPRPQRGSDPTLEEAELVARIDWLIRLRWIAVAGVLATLAFANIVIHLSLPFLPLTLVTAFLAFYNLCFFLYHRAVMAKMPSAALVETAGRVAKLQIFLDLLSLTLLLHFSGGIENPFIFYFIFHMIIASILLSTRESFRVATLAAALFILMVASEYYGVVSHFCLLRYVGMDLHENELYILGISFVFITTLYLSTFMAASISRKLREKGKLLRLVNEELKEQDRVKSEYVLRVSHDLKADLATVQSCLRVVLDGMVGSVNEGQYDMVGRAERRARKLIHFVKDLLDLSRIRAGRDIDLKQLYLQELVSLAIEDMRVKPNDKSISLEIDMPSSLPLVWCDRHGMEHLFVNLITNAVKYTPRGGTIRVEAREETDHVLVKISDTGIGIPAADLPLIFDEFHRAENACAVEKDGTGLGLAIVKHIVQIHGGKIWVDSEENKGSCFSFTLPKVPPRKLP